MYMCVGGHWNRLEINETQQTTVCTIMCTQPHKC